METEARERASARPARRFSCQSSRSSFATGVLAFSSFWAGGANAEDAVPTATEAVHEVTVQGNKADALKRASGSSTTIGEREIRNAQPESNAELLRRVPGLQVRTEDPMGRVAD